MRSLCLRPCGQGPGWVPPELCLLSPWPLCLPETARPPQADLASEEALSAVMTKYFTHKNTVKNNVMSSHPLFHYLVFCHIVSMSLL